MKEDGNNRRGMHLRDPFHFSFMDEKLWAEQGL